MRLNDEQLALLDKLVTLVQNSFACSRSTAATHIAMAVMDANRVLKTESKAGQ